MPDDVAIQAEALRFRYEGYGVPALALKDVSLTVRKGEFVVLLGGNGSGKTTLLKHLNALLPVQSGRLLVAGFDLAAKDFSPWALRRVCGIVFQNPDTQFVSTNVAEDVAFGLENYRMPRAEIAPRVREALAAVGLAGFEDRSTHALSGGQKQRVALAGALALRPEILLLDEPTSMLDPEGRAELMRILRGLKGKTTIVMVTHDVEEAVEADRVVLLRSGEVLAEGAPALLLSDPEVLRQASLPVPLPVDVARALRSAGVPLPACPLREEELVELLFPLLKKP